MGGRREGRRVEALVQPLKEKDSEEECCQPVLKQEEDISTLLCRGVHRPPLVLDGAAVLVRAGGVPTHQSDGGDAVRLSELQLLFVSRSLLLLRAGRQPSLPGEAHQRRPHVCSHTQQGAPPLQSLHGCCWVHLHHRPDRPPIWVTHSSGQRAQRHTLRLHAPPVSLRNVTIDLL